jgi:tetratricopeptide (TPR) repeat protein
MPQENVSFQQLFDQALSAQQQKNGDEALKLYQETLDKSQSLLTSAQASVIYHNMSTLAFDKSDFLKAYIWSRKSLALDPSNRIAQQSLEQYSKKFEVPQVAHQISSFQNIQRVVNFVPIDLWFSFAVLFLFLTLNLFYKNFLQRKQSSIDHLSAKSFNWKPLLSFVLLIIFVAGAGLRWNLDQSTKALITTEKTAVQTAAGENKPVIFEAQSGIEVELLQLSGDYAQVRYPGAFSGWVAKKNIEILANHL